MCFVCLLAKQLTAVKTRCRPNGTQHDWPAVQPWSYNWTGGRMTSSPGLRGCSRLQARRGVLQTTDDDRWRQTLAPLKLRPYGAIQMCILLLLLHQRPLLVWHPGLCAGGPVIKDAIFVFPVFPYTVLTSYLRWKNKSSFDYVSRSNIFARNY